MKTSDPRKLISARFQKPLVFLDVVFGTTYMLLLALASVLWWLGKGGWESVVVILLYIVVNAVQSQLTQRAGRPILMEASRTASAFVLGPLLFVFTANPFGHWWPVFMSYGIGNVCIWGVLTGKVLWGRLLVFYYVLLYVASAWLFVSPVDWMQVFGNSVALAMAGFIIAELIPYLAQVFEREMQQAREIEKAYRALEEAHHNLQTTQAQLIQSEKMASLGALTAGIAHEIKNPLNFVNNFASLSSELTEEILEQLDAQPEKNVSEIRSELDELLLDLKTSVEKINEHGKRADGIVRAMMQHASGSSGKVEATDINALINEHIDLAYHGKRAQLADFDVTITRDLDLQVGILDLVPQEIGRVILNLLGNAFDAIYDRSQYTEGYSPQVIVSTSLMTDAVEIRVVDNGVGIDKENLDRVFEPFFTTKPANKGTGLGLSLSFDIISQGHGGTLHVESTPGKGTTMIIALPLKQEEA